jgi:hypothetical protein
MDRPEVRIRISADLHASLDAAQKCGAFILAEIVSCAGMDMG